MNNANRQKKTKIASWSNILPTSTYLQSISRSGEFPAGKETFIIRGGGSSFNDASYLTGGLTFTTERLKRISEIDRETNTVTCEAGVEIGQLHKFLERTDLAFPIYGGSQWVTVGGAVAADIHGKNTQSQGTFGNHVESLSLILADGREVECSGTERPDLFAATIGGMGLTGFIKSAKLKLQKQSFSALHFRLEVMDTIEEAIAHFGGDKSEFSLYTHWTPSSRVKYGKFYSANYSNERCLPPLPAVNFPVPSINLVDRRVIGHVARIVQLLFRLARKEGGIHVRGFNFIGVHQYIRPLNKLLGSVIEYQFAVADEEKLLRIYKDFSNRNWDFPQFSYVLKKLGTTQSFGLLSFVQPGYTLGIWAPESDQTRRQFAELTELLLDLGGRIYLAKDSCVTAEQFEKMYPRLEEWREIVKRYDPHNRIQSDLSRRLNLKPW